MLLAGRCLKWIVVAGLFSAIAADSSIAQTKDLGRGFISSIDATATGEELARQSDLWIFEVSLRPMRMVRVEVTDPKTGEKKKELVWYLIYRAVNRELIRRDDQPDVAPVNDDDPRPKGRFVPAFRLVLGDDGEQKVYHDVIIPEAVAAINERERQKKVNGDQIQFVGPVFKNGVEVIQPIPDAAAEGSKSEEAIYGVAMWRGIDPRTDEFTVFIEGFSNGYQLGKGPKGEVTPLRRVIVQDYRRPGDEFEQSEREFKPSSEMKWVYLPDPVSAVNKSEE